MSVVSVRSSRHTILLVGELPQADLARLSDALARPLSQQLAGASDTVRLRASLCLSRATVVGPRDTVFAQNIRFRLGNAAATAIV